MTRASMFLILVITSAARAQPAAAAGFDRALTAQVYAEALAFIAPRTLEAVPVSRMATWGLRGLTALDPALVVSTRDGRLRLIQAGRTLLDIEAPAKEEPEAWANAAADMASAGSANSLTVRRAGAQGVVQAFFDELFNHLDPYSRYIGPADAAEAAADRAGRAGLGITLGRQGTSIVVRAVIADSPAALGGLRVGDTILAVDGQAARGQDSATVAALIGGIEDSTVTVTWRGRDQKFVTASFIRALVPPETVFSERSGELLLIRITGFSETTDIRLAHSLQEGLAGPRPPAGIVLDLRGNRGGLVRQAVTVADMFLEDGIVATTAGRAPEASHIWHSTEGELAIGMPVVVMVDGHTASAAEILAAALADRRRAVALGSVTLGKGLVQTIDPLPDGGELYVTWSRVIAPRGWPIQGLGLLPQVCTSMGPEAARRQLAILSDGIQPQARNIAAHRAARAALSNEQIAAIRQFCPPADGRETDLEAARVLIRDPAAYAAALLPR